MQPWSLFQVSADADWDGGAFDLVTHVSVHGRDLFALSAFSTQAERTRSASTD
jgi:hypothetical protein